MNRPRLWTKDFLTITSINFFVSLSFFLLLVIISIYAMDTYGSSPGAAGLAASLFILGGLITRIFTGKAIDRIGRRKTLYIGAIFYVLMTASYFAANSFFLLLVIRFLHGTAFGIISTAVNTVVANIIPAERRGEGMGYYISLSATLSAAIGPFLGMFIRQYGSYQMIFLVCMIFAVLSLLSSFLLTVPEIKLTAEQLRETQDFKFKSFFETRVIPISIFCGLIYFCYSSVITFLSAYAQEVGLVGAASFFFVVFSIAILVSRPFTGRWFDTRGENFVMYPAIALFVIGLLVFSQAHHGYILLLAGALIGFGLGTIQSSSQTITIKVSPPHHTGLATSTFLMFVDIGVGIGPIIYGVVIDFTSYREAYLIAAIVALISMLSYYLLHGRKAGQYQAARMAKV